jgi:CHAT domain-containing protein
MARQRYSLFTAMERVLDMLRQWFSSLVGKRLSALMLVGLFVLSVGIAPVRSQQTLNMQSVQSLYQSGYSYRACATLLKGLGVLTELCEPEKRWNTENWEELENALKRQPQPKKIITYHLLGSVMQAIGKFKESERFLKEGLEIQTLSAEEKGVFHLSLGNTLKASGDVIRDRLAPSKYDDYRPWDCQQTSMPDQNSKEYMEINNKYNDAIINYNEVQNLAKSGQVRDEKHSNLMYTKALVNLVDLQTQRSQAIDLPDDTILSALSGETRTYAQISMAKKLSCKLQKESQPLDKVLSHLIAISTAEPASSEKQHKRSKSYALGSLGGFYEYLAECNSLNSLTLKCNRKDLLEHAMQSTEEALYLTQSDGSADMKYQWQWQLGRLYKKQGNRDQAIAFYTQAINTLKKVRRDLIAIKSDVQFSFRDNTIPLYRELIDLLLRLPSDKNDFPFSSKQNDAFADKRSYSNESKDIQQAIEVIDDLQLADLENFLRCDLSKVIKLNRYSDEYIKDSSQLNQPSNERIKNKDAVLIYPIFLSKKFKVLYKIPGSPWEQKEFDVPASVVEGAAKDFRFSIVNRKPQSEFIQTSKQLYDWLVRPIEDQLIKEKKTAKTLVFVLDGELRNIPLAALHDGNDYLIKKEYSLAILPGSQLFDLSPLKNQKMKILAAVVTQVCEEEECEVEGHSFKKIEAEEILHNQIGYSRLLRNDEFTRKNLQDEIQSGEFSIVHITTHGSFSSDPENTYLLAFDKTNTQKAIGTLLRAGDFSSSLNVRGSSDPRPIKLLVLSACETATGDNRATLGLAGFAIRSGANSTLSTLWRIRYDSTQVLMNNFYKKLRDTPNITKAEALHLAQKELSDNIIYQDPRDWAGYILIGNWL